MKERIKNVLKILDQRYAKATLTVLFTVTTVLAIRFFLFQQSTPTLEDVLSQNTGKGVENLSMFIASLLAISLATFSAAKSYELFKKNRLVVSPILPDELADIPKVDSAFEELQGSNEELKTIKEWLEHENAALKERLSNLSSEVEEINKAEQMLRKSNISLSKECERLKSENEMLLLKINSLMIKPKSNTKDKTKTKRKTKARAKKVGKKKGRVKK